MEGEIRQYVKDLELDNPYWAGVSADRVSAISWSLAARKSRYRIIGALVGAAMIVVLTAWFPDRMMPSCAWWQRQ
jgi:hypothetical protein